MTVQPDPAAVQELLDEAAVMKLQRRYMFAIDWADADVMASLFTADGILEWPGGKAEGFDQIHAMFTNSAASPTRRGALRHLVGNTVVDVQGDTARARAYWLDVDLDKRTNWPFVDAYGHYEDTLERTAEGWRFKRRTVLNERLDESEKRSSNPAW